MEPDDDQFKPFPEEYYFHLDDFKAALEDFLKAITMVKAQMNTATTNDAKPVLDEVQEENFNQ
jgi:hypothetical protein